MSNEFKGADMTGKGAEEVLVLRGQIFNFYRTLSLAFGISAILQVIPCRGQHGHARLKIFLPMHYVDDGEGPVCDGPASY